MKKQIPLLAAALFASLFIYVFYRTDKTLVNQVIIALFSRERYLGLKTIVTTALPLRDYIIYSLPEGLWVFCITLTSSFFYLEVQKRKWYLATVPLLLAVIMELCQLLHVTNGRFDIMDIALSFVFWLLALFWTSENVEKAPLFRTLDTKFLCCITSYSIVYLAHVTY